MRWMAILLILALLTGAVALAKPEPEPRSYRDIVKGLEDWVKAREKNDDLDEKPLEEVGALVEALGKLGAKELYEGLSPEERRKLREMLDKEARQEGYADRVVRISDDVGLDIEDSDKLLELYTAYREEQREAGWGNREARDDAEKKFEKACMKAFGRKKAKAIANAVRRTSRRGR